jgi:hypothetical protein
MAATILTTLLNDGPNSDGTGVARISTLVNARGADKTISMELLQAGDKLVFMITIAPKGGNNATPLGNNTISQRTYKVIVTLASSA